MLEEALEGLRKDVGLERKEDVDEYVVDLAGRVRREEARLAEEEAGREV